MTCRYCNRQHDRLDLCRPVSTRGDLAHGVTRRAFFFFGLAAAVAPFVEVPSLAAVLHVNGVDLSDCVVDPLLTEISVRYAEESYIADKVFPIVGRGTKEVELSGVWDPPSFVPDYFTRSR